MLELGYTHVSLEPPGTAHYNKPGAMIIHMYY